MAFPELQKYSDDFDFSENWIFLSEGRNYKGLSQYRYAVRKKPADVHRFQIRGGRTSEEFKMLGIKYVRDGYEQVGLQLFKDSSGITRHQGVWFKYKDPKNKNEERSDTLDH